MKNKILPIIAVIALIFAIFVVVKLKPSEEKEKPIREPSSFDQQENIAENSSIIVGLGTIEPQNREINISPYVSGVVDEIYVVSGDKIKKDDKLFLIDDKIAKAKLDSAASQIEIAKAQLANAKIKFELYEKIDNKEAIVKEELENRRNIFLESSAKLLEAESRFREAEIFFQQHLIKSPIDGIVLKENLQKGEYVSSAADPNYMIIATSDEYNVRVQIDEFNLAEIKPTAKAKIITKTSTKTTLQASFVRVEPYVEAKRNLSMRPRELVDTKVIEVIFKIDNPNSSLIIGQQVDVYIQNQ